MSRPGPAVRPEARRPARRTALISAYPLETCFSEQESEILRRVLHRGDTLPSGPRGELSQTFDRSFASLLHLIRAIESCPSIYVSETFAGRTRGLDSLVDTLCRCDTSRLEFLLPSRAIVGQAFQQTKINFFKALTYHLSACDDAVETQRCVEGILEEAVYIRLAEELLVAYLTNPENPVHLKREAAKLVLPIWEHRQVIPMEAFTRLLVSVWRARCRLRETFGTLIGVEEVFTLMRQECEHHFLDFFTREVVTENECEAFREFLFGLADEDLKRLNAYMEENGIQVIGPTDVWRILGHPPPPRPDPRFNAEAVFASYRRRRIRAEYRVLSHAPGPHKTAEGYIMEYHLSQLASRGAESSRTKNRRGEGALGRGGTGTQGR